MRLMTSLALVTGLLLVMSTSLAASAAAPALPATSLTDSTPQNILNDSTDYQNLKAVNGRARVDVALSLYDFQFAASNLCNKEVGNGICLDISGKGNNGATTIVAGGIFFLHLPKSTGSFGEGHWTATDLLRASSKEISFKAQTTSGIVYIKLSKGVSETSGKACAYGPILGIQRSRDAVCVSDAVVVINSISSREKEVTTSISGFQFAASNLCNKELANGICLDIWGKGSSGANVFTAGGIFSLHLPKAGGSLGEGRWTATQLLTSSGDTVAFEVVTTSGSVSVKLKQGNTPNSGTVCAYGPILGISNQKNAVCDMKAFVVIETTGA